MIINVSISWFENRKIPGSGTYLGLGLSLRFYPVSPSNLGGYQAPPQGIRAWGHFPNTIGL